MAGYIINPFSSDFNPTTSVSYSAEPIPIVAYGLIGLTTLTLAYVTLVASKPESAGPSISSPTTSATSMLPSIFSPKTPASPSMVVSPFGTTTTSSTSVQPPTAKPTVGGKTRNKKHKHKKTKRSH